MNNKLSNSYIYLLINNFLKNDRIIFPDNYFNNIYISKYLYNKIK